MELTDAQLRSSNVSDRDGNYRFLRHDPRLRIADTGSKMSSLKALEIGIFASGMIVGIMAGVVLCAALQK